jgi:hypothetical protein
LHSTIKTAGIELFRIDVGVKVGEYAIHARQTELPVTGIFEYQMP